MRLNGKETSRSGHGKISYSFTMGEQEAVLIMNLLGKFVQDTRGIALLEIRSVR